MGGGVKGDKHKATPSGSLVSSLPLASYFEATWILQLCYYVMRMCTMSPSTGTKQCVLARGRQTGRRELTVKASEGKTTT